MPKGLDSGKVKETSSSEWAAGREAVVKGAVVAGTCGVSRMMSCGAFCVRPGVSTWRRCPSFSSVDQSELEQGPYDCRCCGGLDAKNPAPLGLSEGACGQTRDSQLQDHHTIVVVEVR